MSTDADSNELAAELGKLPWATLLVTAILTYAAAADAFVLSRLWLWYAVPEGLPVLTWKPFVGLVLGFLVMKRVKHGAGWHTDHTNHVRPPKYTSLYAVALPPSGGDTAVVNMRAGYELSSNVRSGGRVYLTITTRCTAGRLHGYLHTPGESI